MVVDFWPVSWEAWESAAGTHLYLFSYLYLLYIYIYLYNINMTNIYGNDKLSPGIDSSRSSRAVPT